MALTNFYIYFAILSWKFDEAQRIFVMDTFEEVCAGECVDIYLQTSMSALLQ